MAYPVQGLFLPKKFFTTSGSALSSVSPLNAYDAALVKAGISQCNLVYVSSILPPDAEEVEAVNITPGTITFCVMSRMDGEGERRISAGIGWGWIKNSEASYGIVAEAHGCKDEASLQAEISRKLEEMARVRNMRLTRLGVRVESLEVPKGMYGCVLTALIYVPWELEETVREVSKSYRMLSSLQMVEKPNKPAKRRI